MRMKAARPNGFAAFSISGPSIQIQEAVGQLNAIEMKGITKTFPGVRANDDVNFSVKAGEIHVLLGENGAGKTTLMNVLYGMTEPDKGEIYVNGEQVRMSNPSVAIARGIGMVHQHFMLVPPFTVAENIILGRELRKGLLLDVRRAKKELSALSEKYGLKIDPGAKVETLSVGMQQRVEILKILWRGAEILILDEPTAVLTPQEIIELGKIMRDLAHQGKTIILITHKLKEVMDLSDRVTIMRQGCVVETVDTKKTSIEELAEKMVGRKIQLTLEKNPMKRGATILQVDNLRVRDRGVEHIKGISFKVHAGEVLGIAGVGGNGQTELVYALLGLLPSKSGSIKLNGKEIRGRSTKHIINEGVSCIPEDRQRDGLILDFTLTENAILGSHTKKIFRTGPALNWRKAAKYARQIIEKYDVRTPSENVLAGALSGGNQQKMIVARELERTPHLLIAAQPTRGLDVGAIEFVHSQILEQRDKGCAVLLVSLELDEVMDLSDRISVIYDGNLVGTMNATEATERMLGILMAGGSMEQATAERGVRR
jgi:general nucleoside transport system ATP-binding protein